MPRIVVVSDTHELHSSLTPGVLPNADILVHCGDFTNDGREPYILSFGSWLNQLPYEHLIVVAGNHDLMFERDPETAVAMLKSRCARVHYLNESGVEVMGLKFWGSPWSITTPKEISSITWAFQADRGEIRQHWEKIPEGLDVLITHGPPYGDLGGTLPKGEDVGCRELQGIVLRKRPRVHLSGHIHPGYGNRIYKGIRFINAALYRSDFVDHLIKRPQLFNLNPKEGA